MPDFSKIYSALNTAQKEAVDTIDGPLLVLAGPGTGKTQLLSARVANILKKTDTLPQSILCLTFTEAAAKNMHQRLNDFIGPEAYDVAISTYHSFGSDIIRSYPEYFQEYRLQNPIDDLGKRQILTQIIDSLDYSSPLKSSAYRLGDLLSTISELKRALLTPDKLRNLSVQNASEIDRLSPQISELTAGIKTFPSSYKKAEPLFTSIASLLRSHSTKKTQLTNMAKEELDSALEEAKDQSSSKPLTAWKNSWLKRDSEANFVFTDSKLNKKLPELAYVLDQYSLQLTEKGLFDFDDMILRAIEAMKSSPELKYNLQERYLFILLDEFQDTNAAQFELVRLLSDNPVNEGRPNVMAVGDDDQAIYAFQGAEASNMLAFVEEFSEVKVINLTQNYRSHPDIIHVAHNVSGQIEKRLHHELEGVDKILEASAKDLPKEAKIARHEFVGPSEEYTWIANKITELIKTGVQPSDIAVLAPKHKYLEAQVPYLNEQNIRVTYEKRENILSTPIIIQLRLMVDLLLAIKSNNTILANQLFPQVLSLDFYELPIESIWKINWASAKKGEKRSWAELASGDKAIEAQVWFYLSLATQIDQQNLETTLDTLIGSSPLDAKSSKAAKQSPMFDYYFSESSQSKNPLLYYETLSHLSVIREKLRSYQSASERKLNLHDFIGFIEMYEEAEQPLINTHPIAQSDNAVNLSTVYKAKGLEYEYVFLLSCHDEVWGSKARSNQNHLTLPANLRYIRHAGADEDERLRLFFVAITRAKHGLFLTSYDSDETGRQTTRLKYLIEQETDGLVRSIVLPKAYQSVMTTTQETIEAKQASIELRWNKRNFELSPSMKSLLSERLSNYKMSPTHLNSYIDVKWAGPQAFFLNTILRFPKAPTPSSEFGSAIHESLDWYQKGISSGKKPSAAQLTQQFTKFLSRKYLSDNELDLLQKRGVVALEAFIKQRSDIFGKDSLSEVDFWDQGVLIGDAHLTGKIDHLTLDKPSKTIIVRDFKTGSTHKKWKSDLQLHKYAQQLYFYKLLIEGSHRFAGYKVDKAVLEFVEPDSDESIQSLELNLNSEELNKSKKLITSVWEDITELKFPDTSKYPETLKGVKQFEDDLMSGSL